MTQQMLWITFCLAVRIVNKQLAVRIRSFYLLIIFNTNQCTLHIPIFWLTALPPEKEKSYELNSKYDVNSCYIFANS